MPLTLADLTPDVQKYLKQDSAAADGTVPSEAVLAAIGVSIGQLRDEAKQARITSGIEDRWRDAEEAYAGIDDANRGDVTGGHQWTKSMSKDGPITSDDVPDTNNRSTLYVRLTQRYVDAGTAKLGEILLAPGAKSFSMTATPVSDLIDAKDDNRPVQLDHLPGSPLAMRPAKPGELLASTAMPAAVPAAPAISAPPPTPGAPVPAPAGGAVPPAGAAGQVPIRVKDLAEEKAGRADKAAKKAEKRIYDWHVECRRTSQVRKVIFDSGRLGVGVLKGPFPKASRQMATRKAEGGEIEVGIRKTVLPASKWVNAWNFFPDPTCGENIQDGDHCLEREWTGARAVRKFKALPGYIKSQIDKVLIEGPQKVNLQDTGKAPEADDAALLKKGKYEVWYFYGELSRQEMGCICEAAGPDSVATFNAAVPGDVDKVYAIVTMINDTVVKATLNPLDSGEFPYHPMPWQRRTGSWAGVGVAEQIATPQKMLTASVRAMLDNAGISAGGQIVIDTGYVTPADGDMGMSPHKIWYMNGDGEQLDVREAFGLFKIDNVTPQLMEVVNLAMRLGEESTSIPLITQGQSGPTTPDTFGAAQLQNNNANQLLRSIGYTADEVTEGEVRQYYEWLLLDPDVPNDEKGDWTIDPHGSSALVEQALQDQTIAQILPLSATTPAYGLNPKRTMEQYLRSKKLQPKDFQNTDEEQAKIDSAPPPQAPAVQVATIRAGVDEKKLAAAAQESQAALAFDKDELHTNSQIELHKIQQERELTYQLATLEYANKHQITIEQVKAKLADTTMKLQVEKELNASNQAADLHKHHNPPMPPGGTKKVRPQRPAVQVPGRAANGQAASQVAS